MPVTFFMMLEMGTHGASKVDCVTVWFMGANWNCTMSPTFALMSLGVKVLEPFMLPTLTTWTVVSCAGRMLVLFEFFEVLRNVPKAPATLMADRRSVVNCILKYFLSKDPDLR